MKYLEPRAKTVAGYSLAKLCVQVLILLLPNCLFLGTMPLKPPLLQKELLLGNHRQKVSIAFFCTVHRKDPTIQRKHPSGNSVLKKSGWNYEVLRPEWQQKHCFENLWGTEKHREVIFKMNLKPQIIFVLNKKDWKLMWQVLNLKSFLNEVSQLNKSINKRLIKINTEIKHVCLKRNRDEPQKLVLEKAIDKSLLKKDKIENSRMQYPEWKVGYSYRCGREFLNKKRMLWTTYQNCKGFNIFILPFREKYHWPKLTQKKI